MNEYTGKIRITEDEVRTARVDPPATSYAAPPPVSSAASGPRNWGSVSGGSSSVAMHALESGHFFLQSWVYLGLAGMAGAFLAWVICEPSVNDGEPDGFLGSLMFPLMIIAMSVGFAAAESVVERSLQKALFKGALGVVLGLIFGFLFYSVANFVYSFTYEVLEKLSVQISAESPLQWLRRGFAWMIFGAAGGVVYGIVGQSWKKCLYGLLGGIIGAAVGGFLFDPISLLTGGAEASRAIGMMIFGASTGVAIGLVESALKDRWLYVSAGPLAGKQFILYKPSTRIGSDQSNDIYLFKDPSISPAHAVIELRGPVAMLLASGPTYVAGQPAKQTALRSGDSIQIGRYSFQYREKHHQA
jgi:Inner membrane component of T3SS, cytoplasmic domain